VKVLFVILAGVLVLVNSFFVIAEYSLVRSRRTRLEAMADDGVRGARLALLQIDNIGDYLSTCQVGITMASIGIGALGQPAIAHLLEKAIGGAKAQAVAVAISVVIAYLLITVAQSVIGEIVPKLYTIQHWRVGSRNRCGSSARSSIHSLCCSTRLRTRSFGCSGRTRRLSRRRALPTRSSG
jgi:CBS domain containing-hemolysin-like protein